MEEDQAVTEYEEEGDEAGGGDDGDDEEGGDVGRPHWLALHCRAQSVAQVTVAAPHTTPPDIYQEIIDKVVEAQAQSNSTTCSSDGLHTTHHHTRILRGNAH